MSMVSQVAQLFSGFVEKEVFSAHLSGYEFCVSGEFVVMLSEGEIGYSGDHVFIDRSIFAEACDEWIRAINVVTPRVCSARRV